MAATIEYLHDVVEVKSNCFYQKNSLIASETDLPSEVKIFDEPRFFRVAEADSVVQIQESLIETRFLNDTVNISSEITSGLEATKECVVDIKEELGAPTLDMATLESVVQVQESVDGRITEVGLNSEVQVQESLLLTYQGRDPLSFHKVSPPTTNWDKV